MPMNRCTYSCIHALHYNNIIIVSADGTTKYTWSCSLNLNLKCFCLEKSLFNKCQSYQILYTFYQNSSTPPDLHYNPTLLNSEMICSEDFINLRTKVVACVHTMQEQFILSLIFMPTRNAAVQMLSAVSVVFCEYLLALLVVSK